MNNYETPEFRVINSNEENAKFLMASGGFTSQSVNSAAATLNVQSSAGWF